MRVLRLLRGIALTAVTWGVAWAVLGVAIALPSAFPGSAEASVSAPPGLLALPVFYGFVGVWAGSVFAIMMAISERRRAFAELTMARVVSWGVLGGISYPLLTLALNRAMGADVGGLGVALAVTGPFGALSAWVTLRTARRADGRAQAQLVTGTMPAWDAPTPSADPVRARTI